MFRLKDRKKTADFTHPSLVWRLRSGNPSEFLDETYPAKTRVMGLPYGENFIILTSTVFLWYTRLTDRRTYGRYAYTRYSMLSRVETFLVLIALLQDIPITFTMIWTLVFTVCHHVCLLDVLKERISKFWGNPSRRTPRCPWQRYPSPRYLSTILT